MSKESKPLYILQQEFEKQKVNITIVGVKPLLCHRNPYRPTGYTAPKMTDDELFERSLYILPSDNGKEPRYGFPAAAIKSACVNAGRFIPSLAMTQIRGLFWVEDEVDGLVEILHPDGGPAVPVMDCQMVIKKDGKSIPSVRARFDEWKITFTVGYSPQFTNIETITNILKVAGEVIGIGPRRMEKSGQPDYGVFKLV
jgi:hypothetical protein